jgi:hypothetical protein
MSVPLDRLYNHLDGLCNHDILIYRFYPHGSKKLSDLKPLSYADQLSWKFVLKPGAICHDQEPLFFDQYSNADMLSYFLSDPGEKIDPEILARIQNYIQNQHLRSVIDSRFSIYDKTLLIHSEKNSNNLDQYIKAGFVGVYWWTHAALSTDWFRYAQYDPVLDVDLANIDKDFLIYNRAWAGTREYRLKFTEQIVDADLHNHVAMKFSVESEGNMYQEFCPKNSVFKIQRYDLENYFNPCKIDASASADYNSHDYQHTAIEVVLETLFDDLRLHLTEKSLRPIACGRPFILVATPGSLEYLRSYGFKTFNEFIDESYDTVQDPLERLKLISSEMKRIAQTPMYQKKQLWNELYAIANYNKKLFFSADWQHNIFNEFLTNVESALTIMEQHKTGQHWEQFYNAWKLNPEKFKHTNQPVIDSMCQVDKIKSLLQQ